jgi:hypothetical protein
MIPRMKGDCVVWAVLLLCAGCSDSSSPPVGGSDAAMMVPESGGDGAGEGGVEAYAPYDSGPDGDATTTAMTEPDSSTDGRTDAALEATAPGDAGEDGDSSACTMGSACTSNPGAPCRLGTVACTGGQATCIDADPVTDGTACTAGLCARGACLGPRTLTADVDLSAASITSGRVCTAEAPAFQVTGLTPTTATLASAPADDCLVGGDEILLVNMQGSPSATGNVGNWELLEVASVSGTAVTFASAKTRTYGATNDDAIGDGPTDQKVVLLRVPQFGELTVANGARVTTAAWNGATGGVLALRAAKLTVAGTLTTSGLGYRNGRWSRDTAACSESVTTESGESIGGPPVASTASQFGAPGGLGAGSGISFITIAPINAGAGHSTAGEPGLDGNWRTVGDPGIAYGAPDGSKLTLGSGASGNLTCENGFPGPALVDIDEPLAGGIVALFVHQLDVTGHITASANQSSRDTSGSGGYVLIRGDTLNLGAGLVTASGGLGGDSTTASTVASSDGYVVVGATTVTGTTNPAAHSM